MSSLLEKKRRREAKALKGESIQPSDYAYEKDIPEHDATHIEPKERGWLWGAKKNLGVLKDKIERDRPKIDIVGDIKKQWLKDKDSALGRWKRLEERGAPSWLKEVFGPEATYEDALAGAIAGPVSKVKKIAKAGAELSREAAATLVGKMRMEAPDAVPEITKKWFTPGVLDEFRKAAPQERLGVLQRAADQTTKSGLHKKGADEKTAQALKNKIVEANQRSKELKEAQTKAKNVIHGGEHSASSRVNK